MTDLTTSQLGKHEFSVHFGMAKLDADLITPTWTALTLDQIKEFYSSNQFAINKAPVKRKNSENRCSYCETTSSSVHNCSNCGAPR